MIENDRNIKMLLNHYRNVIVHINKQLNQQIKKK